MCTSDLNTNKKGARIFTITKSRSSNSYAKSMLTQIATKYSSDNSFADSLSRPAVGENGTEKRSTLSGLL